MGSIAATLRQYPHIGPVLPAMGYSDEQLRELEATVDAVDCDVVVAGTPIRLDRLIRSRHPIRHASYELEELAGPTLADALASVVEQARASRGVVTR